MKKPVKAYNNKRNTFPIFTILIPNEVKKFDDYYSDVYKERLIDYPMAVLSALVRMTFG